MSAVSRIPAPRLAEPEPASLPRIGQLANNGVTRVNRRIVDRYQSIGLYRGRPNNPPLVHDYSAVQNGIDQICELDAALGKTQAAL